MSGSALTPRRRNVPLYTQLASSLRAEIEAGRWPVGTRLPAIEDLAGTFSVALQTMRQAVSVLEEEGLVLRKQGLGTFVQKGPRDQRWLTLPTDWRSLVGMVDHLEARLLLVDSSDRVPRIRPGEGEAAPAYKYLKRVHYRNDQPFCVIEIYLSAEIYMLAPERFRNEIIVPILDRMDEVDIGTVRQSVSVDVADSDTARLLDIPIAGPIARVRRYIADKNGTVIYAADVLYRGDVVYLDMNLSPEGET